MFSSLTDKPTYERAHLEYLDKRMPSADRHGLHECSPTHRQMSIVLLMQHRERISNRAHLGSDLSCFVLTKFNTYSNSGFVSVPSSSSSSP